MSEIPGSLSNFCSHNRLQVFNTQCDVPCPPMSDDTAHHHTLYLIRHGETVDNIAGVYAGITDSALTNHGVQQAVRLGQHFAKHDVNFTHFFASNLHRAQRTAENIRECQIAGEGAPSIQICPDLREQDFGFYEKKPFYARSPNSKKTGKDVHREAHKDEEGFQDIESKESMAQRADAFLDVHLMPLLNKAPADHHYTVAIVSHGIMLSSLWKAMLRRQKPNSVSMDSEVIAMGKPLALEHLGGWSNTGYLQLELTEMRSKDATPARRSGVSVQRQRDVVVPDLAISSKQAQPEAEPGAAKVVLTVGKDELERGVHDHDSNSLYERKDNFFAITVKIINGKEHLKGLKRTGGGVGSSKFDEGQKSIETFFKRRKTDGSEGAAVSRGHQSECSSKSQT